MNRDQKYPKTATRILFEAHQRFSAVKVLGGTGYFLGLQDFFIPTQSTGILKPRSF